MKTRRRTTPLKKRDYSNKNTKLKQALEDKLWSMAKSTIGLESLKRVEGASPNRCRICVKNLPPNIKQTEIVNLFKEYGPIKEFLIKEDQRMIIITLNSRANAERAVSYLNGAKYHNTILIVRSFRVPTIKVYNLSKHVTNELLQLAFSIFGKIEECYVIVNQHGHCSGEGIVEYENKQSVHDAVKFCRDNCYFLTAFNMPVIVEKHDPMAHHDGQPETLVKRTPSYYKDRGIGPRITQAGTLNDYYGKLFKELHEEYTFAMSNMKEQLICDQERLQLECAKIKYDQEIEHLKMIISEREKERKQLDGFKSQSQKVFKRKKVKRVKHRRTKENKFSPENYIPKKSLESVTNDEPRDCGDHHIPSKRQRF